MYREFPAQHELRSPWTRNICDPERADVSRHLHTPFAWAGRPSPGVDGGGAIRRAWANRSGSSYSASSSQHHFHDAATFLVVKLIASEALERRVPTGVPDFFSGCRTCVVPVFQKPAQKKAYRGSSVERLKSRHGLRYFHTDPTESPAQSVPRRLCPPANRRRCKCKHGLLSRIQPHGRH